MAQTNPNETVYKSRDLSKWFAIGSILLFVAVVWGVLQDFDREWKRYQRQWQRLNVALGERKLSEALVALDRSKLEGLKKKIADFDTSKAQSLEGLDAKIKGKQDKVFKITQTYQNLKAKLDADLFLVDVALAKRSPNAAKIKNDWMNLEREVLKLKDQVTLAEADRDNALQEKRGYLLEKTTTEKDLAALVSEKNRLEKIIAKNEQSLGNLLRNAPLVDFVSPTLKINQIILPHLKDDYFFNKVPRVDRCMTCHANADKAGFEDLPQPFTSHPKLNLMLSEESPHPVQKIGCTVCHSGIPQSADFSLAGHVPKDPAQWAEWEDKYNFNPPKHIPTPMIPTAMTEGKCIQCHAQEVTLRDAPTFNAGMRMIERYGCYNCHKFAGHFEKLSFEKKTGPTLKTLASKLDQDWVRKFIWDPQSYRPSSLMPRFWKNHNNSDPESLERGAVEVESISHYLFKKSVPYQPLKLASGAVGNVARGKELVGSVGCLACHAIADFPRLNPKDPTVMGYKDERIPMVGPELNQMGSKVTQDWLVSWVYNPKHYWDNSGMPSLKLTETEALDIAAYLLTKRNVEFDSATPPEPKDEMRDQIVKTYLMAVMTQKAAGLKLASMSLEDKKLFLGEKLIGHYGCYACHAIDGFENAPKIGAELTYEGSKDLSKFAFENVHAQHTRSEWVYTKIRTPRIWDVGKKRDFEGKTRMPQFNFNHKQAEAITAIVVGYENKNVDDEAVHKIDGRYEKIIAGHRMLNRHNCSSCHFVENRGGDVLAHFSEDVTNGPPNLNTQGLKTRTEWLHAFLLNPNVMIRPWLKIRMPQFYMTDAESMAYTAYFAAFDKSPYPYVLEPARMLTSSELVQVEGMFKDLACLSCHAVRKPGEDVSAAAPHFANVKGRLKDPWVLQWLENPQAIMPGTRMPTLWPLMDEEDPQSARIAVPGYFGDDAKKQIEAMRNYIYQYGGEPLLPNPRINGVSGSTVPSAAR
jgi:cbb3-type cytochrome oxidase cytochrome c subunit